MNATKENQLLTAYALGECSASEAAAMESALARDPELAAELASTRKTCALLEECLGDKPLTLGSERVAQIRKSGRRPDKDIIVMQNHRRSRWQTAAVVLASAALITLGFFILNRTSVDDPLAKGASRKTGGIEKASSGVASRTGAKLRDGAPESKKIELAVGSSSLAAMENVLVRESRLPEASEVNLAELLAYPDYETPPQFVRGGVAVSSETGPCPWREDAVLVAIWLESEAERNLSLEVKPNRAAVRSMKRVGAPEGGKAKLLEEQAFRGQRCLLYEIVPSQAEGELFSLTLTVAVGQTAEEGFLEGGKEVHIWQNASPAWRTAVTLAGFGKTLQGKTAALPLAEWKKRAADLSSKSTDSRTRYVLDLISLAAEVNGK